MVAMLPETRRATGKREQGYEVRWRVLKERVEGTLAHVDEQSDEGSARVASLVLTSLDRHAVTSIHMPVLVLRYSLPQLVWLGGRGKGIKGGGARGGWSVAGQPSPECRGTESRVEQ